MSMNAAFVQVDAAELSRLVADPSLAEVFFDESVPPPALPPLTEAMRDRVRRSGPQLLAATLSGLDPALQRLLEDRLGMTTATLAAGGGGNAILELMEQRQALAASTAMRPVLSLEKAWHGVHYVLCGEAEPGQALLSQPVLGGVELGEEGGFSGYGPPRYFTAAQVAELARALNHPDTEAAAAARFDAARMTRLQIYPGWRNSDANWVMDNLRRLRDFYSEAAGKGNAIVTSLL